MSKPKDEVESFLNQRFQVIIQEAQPPQPLGQQVWEALVQFGKRWFKILTVGLLVFAGLALIMLSLKASGELEQENQRLIQENSRQKIKLDQLGNQVERLAAERNGLRSDLSNREAEVREQSIQIEGLEQEVVAYQDTLQTQRGQISTLHAQIDQRDRLITLADSIMGKLAQELGVLEQLRQEVQDSLKVYHGLPHLGRIR